MQKIARHFALILPLLIGSAQAQILSNEQLVISSVRIEALKDFADFNHQRVQVITNGTPLNELIASGLADALRGKSAEVMLASERDSTSENVTFNVLGFEFKYGKGASRGFLKHHKIKRELNCQLRLLLTAGATGSVLDTKDIAINYVDEIEPNAVGFANSKEIPELSPPLPGSTWSKFAEPALVVASVGVLVYLFFANR